MKNLVLCALALMALSVDANAQVTGTDTSRPSTLLFPEFKPGYVLMTSGAVEKAEFNYDAYDHQVVYLQAGQPLTLTNLADIDTVYFAARKFVPIKKEMYEIIELGNPVSLLVVYDAKIRPYTASAEHDGTSRKSSNAVMNNITSTNVARSRYQNGFEVELKRTFWLQRYKAVYKTTTEKSVLKAFPEGITETLKQYISEKNIDVKNPDQLLELVKFANSKKQGEK